MLSEGSNGAVSNSGGGKKGGRGGSAPSGNTQGGGYGGGNLGTGGSTSAPSASQPSQSVFDQLAQAVYSTTAPAVSLLDPVTRAEEELEALVEREQTTVPGLPQGSSVEALAEAYTNPQSSAADPYRAAYAAAAGASPAEVQKMLRPQDEPSLQEKIEASREKLAMLQRDRREKALRTNIQGPHAAGKPAPGVGKVDQMTQEEYDALSPTQRAAVDFNTMLVSAVRKDARLEDDYNPNEQEQLNYTTAVEDMFGKDGGSLQFAPETVAVLRQINFSDQAADLDDFLGLNAAITNRDLRHMEIVGPTVAEAEMNPVQLDRMEFTEDLASDTARMQAALVRGRELLATINQTAMLARGQRVAEYGGTASTPKAKNMLGFGPATDEAGLLTRDGYFRMAFDKLADPRNASKRDSILEMMQNDMPAADYKAFWQFADQRATNAERYNQPLGETEGIKYLDPSEFRTVLSKIGG